MQMVYVHACLHITVTDANILKLKLAMDAVLQIQMDPVFVTIRSPQTSQVHVEVTVSVTAAAVRARAALHQSCCVQSVQSALTLSPAHTPHMSEFAGRAVAGVNIKMKLGFACPLLIVGTVKSSSLPQMPQMTERAVHATNAPSNRTSRTQPRAAVFHVRRVVTTKS